ncbi:unnamed protein product, partial [Laminaria digitata]
MPPVPAFERTLNFCGGGGEILRLIEETTGHRGGGDGKRKASNASHGPSSPNTGTPTPRKKRDQVCRMFASTGRCRWDPCVYVHASPPADSSSPLALRGGGGGSLAAP